MAFPLVAATLGLLGAAAIAKGVLDPRIVLKAKSDLSQVPSELRTLRGKNPFVGFFELDAPEGKVQLQALSTEGESGGRAGVAAWYKAWKKAGKPTASPMPIYMKSPNAGGLEFFGDFKAIGDDPDSGTVVIPMMFVPKGA